MSQFVVLARDSLPINVKSFCDSLAKRGAFTGTVEPGMGRVAGLLASEALDAEIEVVDANAVWVTGAPSELAGLGAMLLSRMNPKVILIDPLTYEVLDRPSDIVEHFAESIEAQAQRKEVPHEVAAAIRELDRRIMEASSHYDRTQRISRDDFEVTWRCTDRLRSTAVSAYSRFPWLTLYVNAASVNVDAWTQYSSRLQPEMRVPLEQAGWGEMSSAAGEESGGEWNAEMVVREDNESNFRSLSQWLQSIS